MTKRKHLFSTLFIAYLSGCIAFILYNMGYHDTDFLWHIKLGESIVKTKEIFHQDIFSWVSNEIPLYETAHSWGSGVFMYFLYSIIGNIYLFGGIYCCLTAMIFTFILGLLFFKEHSIWTVLLGVFIGMMYSNPRPQSIGSIFFIISIYLLINFTQKSKSKSIYFLPFIALLWANFHGGSIPMLFAFEGLVLCYSLVPSFNLGKFKIHRFTNKGDLITKDTLKISFKDYFLDAFKMGFVLLGSILTGCINPYGRKLYIYFFITNNETTKQFISEWNKGTILNLYSIIILIVLLGALIFSKKQIPLLLWLFPFICFILGGVHQRILVQGVLCCFPLITYLMTEFPVNRKGKNPYTLLEISLCTIAIPVIMFIFFYKGIDKNFLLPESVTNYIKEQNYTRLYNSYDDGSKLIFENIPCFIDSRGDLYPGSLLEDAAYFTFLGFDSIEDIDIFLNTYQFDAILLHQKNIQPIIYLTYQKNWTNVFQQDNYIIFEKLNNN